jgi:DNA-binding MarR family transcriptional regulator
MTKKSSVDTPDYELLFTWFNELGIISQLSSTMFERNLPEGLTLSQFSVLNWFERVDDQATPGRLAKAFQVTKGAMTNTLKKLKEKQLVTVEQDVNSGRQKIVKITAPGRQMRDQAIQSTHPLMEELLASIDLAAIKQQLVAIQEVRVYLDEYRYR